MEIPNPSRIPIRAFRRSDAAALAELSRSCLRGETDFVLNPLWESEDELFAEFERFGIAPEEHLRVAGSEGEPVGLVGFLRQAGANVAGLYCPVVRRDERGRGLGGALLRSAEVLAGELGIQLATAGIGTRNRAGYALLSSLGFRPLRQHFLMRCDERPRPSTIPLAGLELDRAKLNDAGEILEIYLACGFDSRSAEQMNAIFEDGRHTHAVARHDGRVVAFAEIETHWPQRPWVAFVGVEAEHRDRGVGSNLVAWALAQQFDAGATSGLLMLSPANRTALRAYEKVGFRRHRLIDVLQKAY